MTAPAKTAVIYARVSTARQADEELPVESQLDACERRAADLDAQVLRQFVDAGVSGTTDARPQFQAALAYAEAMNVDYFITWSTSRFSRNRIDAALYKRDLRRAGIKIVFCSSNVDFESGDGAVLEAVIEAMDARYSQAISEDTRRSMLLNAQKGYWNGSTVPFGFMLEPVGKRKRMVPNEDETPIVRQIFDLRASGHGIRQIVAWLRDNGVLRRGQPWTYAPVQTMLRSRSYIGERVFNKKCRDTGQIRPESEWIIVKSHDPIVDLKVWQNVQQQMDRHRTDTVISGRSQWLLTGLLRDPDGACLLIQTATGRSMVYSYYTSPAWVKSKRGKPQRRRADILEDFLIEQILGRVITTETMRKTAEAMQQSTAQWSIQRDTELKALRSQLDQHAKRRSRLFDILELQGRDAPNLGDLTTRLRELNQSIKRLESSISDRECAKAPVIGDPNKIATQLGDELRQLLKDPANRQQAATFISRLIDHVVIHSDRAEIVYKTEFLNETTASGAVVHSALNWLPEAIALRTARLVVELPARLCVAA